MADDEIGDDFLELVGLVDGEDARRNFINFKPGIIGKDPFERFVFQAGKSLAPFGFFGRETCRCGILRSEEQRKNEKRFKQFARKSEKRPPRSAAATGAGERLSSRLHTSVIQQKAPASEVGRYTEEKVRATES